jgi:hypothetical protein
MNNIPRTEPCPRLRAGGPAGLSRAVPGTAGRGLPGSRRPEGGWAMLRRELEFLSGTAGLVSLLAQFDASYPADG